MASPKTLGEFEPAKIIAMVGDQPILAGDLLAHINEMLQPHAAELEKMTDQQRQQQYDLLMQKLLPQVIDLKLLYLDFLRQVPKERMADIRVQIEDRFRQTQLDELVKNAKVSDANELDSKLRALGSSLEHQKRLFMERVLASQAKIQKVKFSREVTPDEMLAYYYDHISDYEFPAKARWERLMVRFEKFPTKGEARRAIADMGNQVWHGASLAAVAKRSSHGTKADEGGMHDWTTQGSLVSEVIDRAIFRLPVGKLSPILEDDSGYHIIRVIERRDAGRLSFVETQDGIRKKIVEQRQKAEEEKYVQNLRQGTPIWTVFDDSASARGRIADQHAGPQRF